MTLAELKTLLSTTGIPVAMNTFKTEQQYPYIVYIATGAKNTSADGIVYYSTPQVQVELYTKDKDLTSEDKVETALSSFFWEKDEGRLDDENSYMVAYQFTL